MTSLTGSAGEDFASILRALGYRMERRPPLPPKPVVVETVAAETPPVEGAGVAPADVVAEATSELVETPLTRSGAPTSGRDRRAGGVRRSRAVGRIAARGDAARDN